VLHETTIIFFSVDGFHSETNVFDWTVTSRADVGVTCNTLFLIKIALKISIILISNTLYTSHRMF